MDDTYAVIKDIIANWDYISSDRFVNAALALLLATVAGFITGPRGHSAVPLVWRLIDITFGALGERLNKRTRSEGDLLFRGFITVVILILFTGALGLWLEGNLVYAPQSRLVEILLLSFCISTGAVINHGMRLHQVLKGAKMSEGTYLVLARTSRLDLSSRDDFTLTRTGTELLVRFYDKAAVNPLLWYVLGGLPAVMIYAALAAYSWKTAYDGTVTGTGTIGQALEKLMGFVPSTFAASLLAMTTLIVPGSGPFSGLQPLLKPDLCLPYEQGGQPMSVTAYALNLTLGGPVSHLNGVRMSRKWTGPESATAQLAPDYLKRVLYMVFIAYLYLLAGLFGALLYV